MGHQLSCSATVRVCVILHMFHIRVQLSTTPLSSSHHHIYIRLLAWLSIIVLGHICPHTLVGLVIGHESSPIQLLPSRDNLLLGPIHCRLSSPWQKPFPAKKNVSIGPMCHQSQHMRDGQPAPRVAPMQEFQRTIPDMVIGMPLWGIPVAPRLFDVSHTLWTVARDHHNVLGTQWRHTLEASPSTCPRV